MPGSVAHAAALRERTKAAQESGAKKAAKKRPAAKGSGEDGSGDGVVKKMGKWERKAFDKDIGSLATLGHDNVIVVSPGATREGRRALFIYF